METNWTESRLIPSFLKNEELSVAIKNAGSDSEILRVLYQTIKLMDIKDALQLSGIFLLCDADAKTAEEKRDGRLNEEHRIARVSA